MGSWGTGAAAILPAISTNEAPPEEGPEGLSILAERRTLGLYLIETLLRALPGNPGPTTQAHERLRREAKLISKHLRGHQSLRGILIQLATTCHNLPPGSWSHYADGGIIVAT